MTTIGTNEHNTLGTGESLEKEWLEGAVASLSAHFAEAAHRDSSFIDVYGERFEDEIVTVFSYVHEDDASRTPKTLFIAHPIVDDVEKMKKLLPTVLDLAATILESVLDDPEWSDFNAQWTENPFKGLDFAYKITRENISLTLQADRILAGDIEIH